MEKITTNKGKPCLLVEGFKYRIDKENKTTHLWRCIKRSCIARCKTDIDDLMILDGKMEHNHEADDDRKTERHKLRQECKRKAEEQPTERPKKIIIAETGKIGNHELIPEDVSAVRQAVYRVRRKSRPKLPKSRAETHESLADYSLDSTNGENMLLVNDATTGIIMYSSRSNLEFISEDNVEVFGDGTFKYCPRFFYQLYTLHGYKNGRYVPCIFFLLPSKTKLCYKEMFQHSLDVCRSFGINLNMSVIHLDFEEAVFDAVRSLWPNIVIKGCHFHLSQAWWRKIQALGLAVEYKSQNSNIGKWLKLFFGLSFLEENEVEECIAFDIFSSTPEDDRAVEFADYILKNYGDSNAKFPPMIWTESNLDSKRTNNGCEGFHRQFSDMFYHQHPNIFEFMEKLNQIQTFSYLKMRAAAKPAQTNAVEKNSLAQMKNIQQQYKDGEITRAEYVHLMAYRNQPVINL